MVPKDQANSKTPILCWKETKIAEFKICLLLFFCHSLKVRISSIWPEGPGNRLKEEGEKKNV